MTRLRTLACAGAAAFALCGAAAPAAAWDPLANWGVAEEALSPDEVRITLHLRRLRSGGDGEARVQFRRRIEALARAGGYRDYVVLDYAEGIESHLPIAQRYAVGIVRFIP